MDDQRRITDLQAQLRRMELERDSQNAELQQMRVEYASQNAQLQNTTLDEFLEACHESLFTQLRVQGNPFHTTTGTITAPTGKPCPKQLRPWKGFQRKQNQVYGKVRKVFNPPDGPLRELISMKGIQEQSRMLKGVLGSEEDLKRFQHKAVEQYVELMLKVLASTTDSGQPYANLGNGVEFHNQPHILADGQPEVEQRRNVSTKTPPPANSDQYLITRKDDRATLLLIEEFKAAHKLTMQFLKAALQGDLDILEIRDRYETSNNPDEKYIENAERLVAAAATQTYSYMLAAGLEYSCIFTGEAIVFLHIKENHPDILYYHLAIPSEDVMPDIAPAPDYSKSAIAQLAIFAVLASQSKQRSQDWRDTTLAKADSWVMDYEAIERKIETPRHDRRESLPSSAFKGPKGPISKKDHHTRSRRRDDDNDDDNDSPGNGDNDNDTHGESSDELASSGTPSKSRNTSGNKGNNQGRGRNAQRQQSYCTQACLLGLVRKPTVDEACPNAAQHPRKPGKPSLHSVSVRKLRALIHKQLGETLDSNCVKLEAYGARSMMFRLTLASHGYTFIGKGTIDVFVPDLRHEGEMYIRLRSLQGSDVPVYLGNIDLKRKWYEYGVCITHMLLMSYGGERVEESDAAVRTQVIEFEEKIGKLGIQHQD
ncbi:MAG: hypothetical protein Q9218_004920, partial [Villophora microphyllina]